MCYFMRMTKDEIKAALKARGWTYGVLAEKLRVSEGTIKNAFKDGGKLTEQLAAHIELLLSSTQEALVMFKLTFPEVLCQAWLPGWEKLSPEQRKAGIEAVLLEAAKIAAQEAERKMTYEEIERLKAFCAALRGPSGQYEYEAAEPED